MTSQTVTLSTTVSTIYTAGTHAASTVFNAGPGNVSLSDNGNSGSGWPLAVGSSVEWGEGKGLYASADQVGTTLAVSDDVSNPFSANTIAQAIISQGLAGQIATAINNGGLSQQIASAISSLGVPAVDAPMSIPIADKGGGVWQSAITNVAGYSSVRGLITFNCSGSVSANGNDICTVKVEYGEMIFTSFVVSNTELVESNETSNVSFAFPAQGSLVRITATVPTASQTLYTIFGIVYSSYRNVIKPTFTVTNAIWSQKLVPGCAGLNIADSMATSRYTSYYLTANANTRVIAYPSYSSGQTTWAYAYSSGALATGLDHYLETIEALALTAGVYGQTTGQSRTPNVVTGLYLGGKQPQLIVGNNNSNNVVVRGALIGAFD